MSLWVKFKCIRSLAEKNKKCGRQVRPTRYAPPASNDTGTALGQDSSDWSLTLRCDLDFDLGGYGACGWCGSSSSIPIPSLKFVGLAIWKIWRTMCVTINGPCMTLTFDLGGHALWLMRVDVLRPCTKFELRMPCRSEDMAEDMAHDVSALMGLVTLTFWPWNWYASRIKGGNLHSKFGHARPSGSPVIRYVHHGQMDGRSERPTDGQKQRLMSPSLWAGHNNELHSLMTQVKRSMINWRQSYYIMMKMYQWNPSPWNGFPAHWNVSDQRQQRLPLRLLALHLLQAASVAL